MHPSPKDFATATRVVIVPMTAAHAMAAFPAVQGLAAHDEIYVVVSEMGAPLLITDTRAEALRQIQANDRVVLASLN